MPITKLTKAALAAADEPRKIRADIHKAATTLMRLRKRAKACAEWQDVEFAHVDALLDIAVRTLDAASGLAN